MSGSVLGWAPRSESQFFGSGLFGSSLTGLDTQPATRSNALSDKKTGFDTRQLCESESLTQAKVFGATSYF